MLSPRQSRPCYLRSPRRSGRAWPLARCGSPLPDWAGWSESIRKPAFWADDLVSAVTAITRSLLAADRKTLLEMGLLGLELEGMGPKPTAQAGGPGTLERDLTFRVLFEFIEKPGEEEGIITTIPLDIRIG